MARERASVRASGQAARAGERDLWFDCALSLPPASFLPSCLPACLLAFLSFFLPLLFLPSFFLRKKWRGTGWLLSPPSLSLSGHNLLNSRLAWHFPPLFSGSFRLCIVRVQFFPGAVVILHHEGPIFRFCYCTSIGTAQAFHAPSLPHWFHA